MNAVNALKIVTVGLPDVEIKRSLISSLPYASISAKIGKGPRSLLILNRKSEEDLHWVSADRAVIVTRHGRVTRSFGFPENIAYTEFLSNDPVNRQLHTDGKKPVFVRVIDLEAEDRKTIPILSEFVAIGPREIEIAELKIKTILVREDNVAKTINWKFSNYYWADIYDGYIWKSRQHISRHFPPIEIEVLKPSAQ